MTYPIDSKALANLLLDWADADGIPISPMKLQKLLYFCHADFLGQYGFGLIKQGFEAWDYGPVVPSIYKEFQQWGKRAIRSRAESFNPAEASRRESVCELPSQEQRTIRLIYERYRYRDAEELSDRSHERGGPWRHARSLFSNGLNMDRRITDEMIRNYHRLFHG